jgi:hypothetical protein
MRGETEREREICMQTSVIMPSSLKYSSPQQSVHFCFHFPTLFILSDCLCINFSILLIHRARALPSLCARASLPHILCPWKYWSAFRQSRNWVNCRYKVLSRKIRMIIDKAPVRAARRLHNPTGGYSPFFAYLGLRILVNQLFFLVKIMKGRGNICRNHEILRFLS